MAAVHRTEKTAALLPPSLPSESYRRAQGVVLGRPKGRPEGKKGKKGKGKREKREKGKKGKGKREKGKREKREKREKGKKGKVNVRLG